MDLSHCDLTVIQVSPETTILETMRQLSEREVTGVVVVDADQHFLGLFNDRALLRFNLEYFQKYPSLQEDTLETSAAESYSPAHTPVTQIMHPPTVICRESDLNNRQALNALRNYPVTTLIPILDDHDRLQGVVTPSSLQKALQAQDLKDCIIALQNINNRLEAQNTVLQDGCGSEDLEQLVRERIAQIQKKGQRDHLLSESALQIRSLTNLQDILDTSVEEIRAYLDCDRVMICQLYSDFRGVIAAESLRHEEHLEAGASLLQTEILDRCLTAEWLDLSCQKQPQVVRDLKESDLTPRSQAMLLSLGIRSNVVVPILIADQLWGLMIASYRDQAWDWQNDEIDLLEKLAIHIAIAIEHATPVISVGVFRMNLTGDCIYANQSCCKIFGLSLNQLLGDGWSQIIHPADREWVLSQWTTAVQEQKNFETEYRLQTTEGKIIWVHDQTMPERNAAGKVTGYVGTLTDISDRKQAEAKHQRIEAELRDSETRYRAVVQNANDMIILANTQGHILEFNPKTTEILGYTAAELATMHISQLHPPAEVDQIVERFKDLTNDRKFHTQDLNFLCRNGDIVTTSASVVFVDLGQASFVQGTFRDIRCRKADELALQRMNALLETISQAQSQFITDGNRQSVFNHLLTQLLELTDSELGFIGEISLELDGTASIDQGFMKQRGSVHLQTHRIINIAWNEETQWLYQEGLEKGMRFENLNTLLGSAMVTGQPVIAHSPRRESASGGLLEDHPLHAFLGLPCYNGFELIGMVGIANRPDGYDQSIVNYLQPFLVTCSHLIEGYRLEQEKQAAETALSQSESNYQLLAESVPAVIYRYLLYPDGRDKFPYVSSYVREIYGVEPEAVSQDSNILFSLVHPDDLSLLQLQIQIAAERLETFRSEHRIITTDGRQKWIKVMASSELQADGSILWRGIILDITDQKLAKKNLEETQTLLKTVLDTSPLPLFWKDRNSSFLGYNQRFIEFLNLQHPDELLGKTDYDVAPPECAEAYRADDRLVMETGLAKIGIEEMIVLDNSRKLWLETNKSPLKNAQGEIIGTVGILQDITLRKENQEKLLETNLKLERATRLKDEFLASMSHELRTPLNSILGMAELLDGGIYGSLNLEQNKAVKTIATSGQHLLGLINDILDLAKIEAGKLEIEITTIDLQMLCEYTLQFVRVDAQKKQLDLQLCLPQQFVSLQVDVRRMRQALINLLSNAVKFTPSGGRVSFLVVIKSNGIYFNVADTGIGIAADQQEKLFQPFVQIDSKLNREYSGTGLGLALVKRITELHEGTVSFASRPGKGSCFTIHLPATVIVPAQSQLPENVHKVNKANRLGAVASILRTRSSEPPHLVIAEDNPNTIAALKDYLSAQGYRLSFAHNGQEAIDLIREQRPDLVLMDIQMPGMDGLQAMRILRQDPSLQQLPIIALTALAMTGDKEQILSAGATDYVSKPVRLGQLARLIKSRLN